MRDLKILKDLEMGMGQAAADAFGKSKWEPATRDGKPVAWVYNFTVNFQLQSGQ